VDKRINEVWQDSSRVRGYPEVFED
jgi:hypothetical protein